MRKLLRLAGAGVLVVLLGALTLITAARFLHTGARWQILAASFSSYALPGFLLVLVLCLVVLRRARQRTWVLAGLAVAALGLVVQGCSVGPLFVAGTSSGAGTSGAVDLTVMTSNLEFGRGSAATVAATVAAEHVDVLVLEEVTPDALAALTDAGLSRRLPHRLGVPSGAADGTMIFSRFALGSTRPFELRNTGLDVQVLAPRPFRLLAVHTAQPVGWTGSWLGDLRRARDQATAAVQQGPALMVGDFNATLDHEQFRALLGTGLRDAAEQAGSGWQPTWPSRYAAGWLRPLIAIDHVLASEQYDAVRTHTVEVPGTDHLALVAQLRLRKGD